MAKLSSIVKNQKRKKLINKFSALRSELRKKVVDMSVSPEERWEASLKLQKLPLNSCPTRYRNRCIESGRARAFYRDFGLSRIALRELALKGMIPGVIKASW